MSVGDLIEWIAGALFVLAAFLWSGMVLALAVAGVALVYFANWQFSSVELRFKRRKQ